MTAARIESKLRDLVAVVAFDGEGYDREYVESAITNLVVLFKASQPVDNQSAGVLTQNEARAIYLALHRGAQLSKEDIFGLFLKTSGEQLLTDNELAVLLDKLQGNSDRDYPLYEMRFEAGSHYLPLREAAAWYDCGWLKVEIGEWVLTRKATSRDDVPSTRRILTATDRELIRDAADRHSESK